MDFTCQNLAKLRFAFKPWCNCFIFTVFRNIFLCLWQLLTMAKKSDPATYLLLKMVLLLLLGFRQHFNKALHHALKMVFSIFFLSQFMWSLKLINWKICHAITIFYWIPLTHLNAVIIQFQSVWASQTYYTRVNLIFTGTVACAWRPPLERPQVALHSSGLIVKVTK